MENTFQTIQTIAEVAKNTAQLEDNKVLDKNLGGRPENQRYKDNMEIYRKLALKHFRNGGALETLPGTVFDYFFSKSKDELKAFENTPGKSWFKVRANPTSPYYDEEFSALVQTGEALRENFWKQKAVLHKDINSSKYQLYMANNYRWRLRHDMTSDDKKIEAPVIHRPLPEQIDTVEGEIVE